MMRSIALVALSSYLLCAQALNSKSLSFSAPHLPLGLFRHLEAAEQSVEASEATARYKTHSLDVPIDHFASDNGLFKLRYWIDTQHFKPNGPIFLLDSGETNAIGRLPFLESGILSILSKATHGAGIVIEHRYYGHSMPTQNLSTDNLRFLSTEQAIMDLKYFVENVDLPGLGRINRTENPVILYGGSYAGAKVAFARKLFPETFFGAIASSGVIRAQVNYWNYFEPIRKFGPAECIDSIINTVSLVDSALALKSKFVTKAVKGFFGLQGVTDDRDFANILTFPLGSWQGRVWDPSVNDDSFFSFCSNLTSPSNITTPFSLTKPSTWSSAVNFANYIKANIVPLCPPDLSQDECFGTSNATAYQSVDLKESGWRSWTYQYCTEWGYFMPAAPEDTPSLLSRQIDLEYTSKICKMAFPDGKWNTIPSWPNVTRVNQYGDFDLEATRIAFIDGEEDPWVEACAHSSQAKHGYRREDTLETPYKLIKGAVHHWDEYGAAQEPKEIRKIHAQEVEFVKHWLEHFGATEEQKPKLIVQGA